MSADDLDRPDPVSRSSQIDLGAKPDCSEALHRVYEYLDGEMTPEETRRIAKHLQDCGPCLQEYDLDQALKALVQRACQCEPAPEALRAQIRTRITAIRVTTTEVRVRREP